MCDEYLLTRKAEGGVFLCTALTVCQQRVEPAEELHPPHFAESGSGSGKTRRTQAPADDLASAGVHPLHSGGCGEVAGVRFHDQCIRIPFFEPVDKSHLITKVKRAVEQMNVFGFNMLCDVRRAASNHLFRTGFARKETHPTFAVTREQVKERNAIGWKHALLQSEFAFEVHFTSQREKITAYSSRYSSHHTEAIIAEDAGAVERFFAEVDSAILLHNASTQFADGGEFGMGAEIGIATGRMHARGPVGVEQLTSFKYRVRGAGQVRP